MLKARTMFLRLMVMVALIGLTGRLVWVQAVRAEENLRRGEGLGMDTRPVKSVRGAIVDRAGRYFALSVSSYTVAANLRQIPRAEEQAEVAEKLAPLLSMNPQEILDRFRLPPSPGHVELAKGLDLKQKQRVLDLKLAGITTEPTVSRTYPQGAVANQVIGYLDNQGKGQYGLEAFFDTRLTGTAGYVTAEWTQEGNPIQYTIKNEVKGQPGQTLVLSLDVGLQQLVEQKLDALVKANDAKRALAIAMDVHTGDIVLMAMRPGADLGNRSTWGDPIDYNRITNWAIYNHMSPGSIFKPITTSIALEENAIDLRTQFIDKGFIVRSGARIINWDGSFPGNPAPMTIAQLLQRSSNVGLIQVGETYPRDTFVKYLNAYGFMEKSGIDLVGEDDALFGSPFADKTDVDWANMYIGQHLEVTPIQMITAEAAIANGGYLVQPHVVREIRDPDGKVVWTASVTKRRQVISEETAREVRQLMQSVVEQGTASSAKVEGYTVAGKTGTAQKFEPTGKMKERNLADFIGMIPANNPQIIMLVMVDEPKGQGYGGMIAAPFFAEIAPHVMRSVGIMPDSPAARGEEKAPPKAVSGVVPNLLWLPVERAQERLAQAGLTFKTLGTGDRVSAQSLNPGSSAKVGTEVELTLVKGDAGDGMVPVPDFTGLSLSEAGQLAREIGLTLKPSGSGFVAAQEPTAGAKLPARSLLSVRLAPASGGP